MHVFVMFYLTPLSGDVVGEERTWGTRKPGGLLALPVKRGLTTNAGERGERKRQAERWLFSSLSADSILYCNPAAAGDGG